MTTQTNQSERFEEVLISYSEMCYSVAFALTRNQHRAQDLTRHVLTWAWHRRNSEDGEKDIKMKLLNVLRERFLHHYSHIPCSQERNAPFGEDILCIAQDAEQNIETVSHSVPIAMWSS